MSLEEIVNAMIASGVNRLLCASALRLASEDEDAADLIRLWNASPQEDRALAVADLEKLVRNDKKWRFSK